jgi:hypothetical protein
MTSSSVRTSFACVKGSSALRCSPPAPKAALGVVITPSASSFLPHNQPVADFTSTHHYTLIQLLLGWPPQSFPPKSARVDQWSLHRSNQGLNPTSAHTFIDPRPTNPNSS